MESDSSDTECLPDLESLDDFLASSFDVDDEDEVEGSQENAGSLGLEPCRVKPFMEGAEDEDLDSESPSDWDVGLFTLFCTDSFCGFIYYLLSRIACSTWEGRVAEPQPGTGQYMGPAQNVGGVMRLDLFWEVTTNWYVNDDVYRANDFPRSRKTDGNRGNDSLKRNWTNDVEIAFFVEFSSQFLAKTCQNL